MSTFSMNGVLTVTPKWIDGPAVLTDQTQVQLLLGNGTGDGQADAYWSNTLTLASGADATLDLTALSVSSFGTSGTLYLAAVKSLGIVNGSANVRLTVEPGAANGWDQLCGLYVGKGGTMFWHAPADGLPTSGTSKTIKITNNDAAVSLAGNTTSGSPTVTMADTTGIAVGMLVAGTGIPSGAKIASVIAGTSVALTANATATGSSVSLSFRWPDAEVKVFVAGILD